MDDVLPLPELVFLSCAQINSHIGDDLLVGKHLPDFELKELNWRKFKPEPKVQVGAIIRTTWDYHLHLADFLKTLRDIEASGLKLMNPAALVEWNSKKIYLQELASKGVAIPESYFFRLDSVEQLKDIIVNSAAKNATQSLRISSDWILKPQVSLSAHNTFWIKSDDQKSGLVKAFEALKGEEVILQVFCKEVLDPGEISLVFFNGEFSHAALKTPKNGDFRVQDEHGGYIRNYVPSPEEISTAQQMLKHVPHNWLYARVDMIPTKSNGLLLMELELIEPSLYLKTNPEAPKNFAKAIKAWLA